MSTILKPRKHQQELMDFHHASKMMGTLVWHDMGLGKTLSSLWMARRQIKNIRDQDPEGRVNPKFMVICPKSAELTWKAECSKNTPDILNSMILAPFSQLHNLISRVKYADIRFIIFDESHYIKSPSTNRVAHLAEMLKEIGSVNGEFDQGRLLCLTGTPMPNGAHEIFTSWCLCCAPNLMEAAKWLQDPLKYTQWKETFSQKKAKSFDRYDKTQGKKVKVERSTHQGVANEDMLNQILKEFVHHRQAEDCLDMPDKTPVYIDLNLPDDRLLADANIEEPEAYMALLERLSRAKAPYMFKWVKDFLDTTSEQLIVFSSYTTPLRELQEKHPKHVRVITGAESGEERANAVRAFQAGELRCLSMSFKCGSESLNLQNSCHTLYHGYPWTDGGLRQAMARTYRSGQKRKSFHYFLTSGNNDQRILGIVQRKAQATSTVQDLLKQNENIIITSLAQLV